MGTIHLLSAHLFREHTGNPVSSKRQTRGKNRYQTEWKFSKYMEFLNFLALVLEELDVYVRPGGVGLYLLTPTTSVAAGIPLRPPQIHPRTAALRSTIKIKWFL